MAEPKWKTATREEVKAGLEEMTTHELEAYGRVLRMGARCFMPDPRDRADNALHQEVVGELLEERNAQ
jgi:hypothetical protein